MSSNSFKVKNSLVLTPKDLTTLSSPEAGDIACDINDSNKIKRYDAITSSWIEVGSGAGTGINYIDNPDFESGITGWSRYKDGSSSVPTDGTGGSPLALSFQRSTTSPLRGFASGLLTKQTGISALGEGLSYDFTIDAADKAQVLRISFDYDTQASAGVYTDGYIQIYIYDVTNAKIIEVVDKDLLDSAQGKFVGTFQTSPDSVDYRLIFHVAASSVGGSYAIKIDNVVVGPQSITKGTVVTDWTSFTPSGAYTTNVTYTGRYRRVGDSLECIVNLNFSGATNSSTVFDLNLPTGFQIDTSKLLGPSTRHNLGTAYLYDADTATNRTTATVHLSNLDPNATIRVLVNGAGQATSSSPFIPASGDDYRLHFFIPILGWSSNLKLSEDSGIRQIAAVMVRSGGTNQTISSTATTTIAFDSAQLDTVNAFSSATNSYIIPESGVYDLSANAYLLSLTSGEVYNLFLYSGSDVGVDTHAASGTADTYSVSKSAYFEKGTAISVRVSSTADTSYSVSGSPARTFLSVAKKSSPQTIAASDIVGIEYTSNSGATINSTATDIIFEDLVVDTHNAYNISTGVFTTPQTGWYQINTGISMAASSSWNLGEDLIFQIYKNGSSYRRAIHNPPTSATLIYAAAQVNISVYLKKGDTIKVVASQGSGASLGLSTTTADNYLSITKITGV